MIKRTIVETIYEYDKNGRVTRKIVTETTEEDTNTYWPNLTQPYCGNDIVYCADEKVSSVNDATTATLS